VRAHLSFRICAPVGSAAHPFIHFMSNTARCGPANDSLSLLSDNGKQLYVAITDRALSQSECTKGAYARGLSDRGKITPDTDVFQRTDESI